MNWFTTGLTVVFFGVLAAVIGLVMMWWAVAH